MIKNPRIIIVGAGISGIAAARRLFENGYTKLTILEAENRIGGRIYTVKHPDGLLEFGAQWCHGEKGNIVHNLVKDLNILGASFNTYADLTYYDSSGKVIDKNLTDELFGIFAEISYDEESLLKEKASFGNYFTKRYNERIQNLFSNDPYSTRIALNLLDWFHNFTLCYDGASSWFEISALGILQYKECDGNLLLHWKHHGSSTILDVLMQRYPDKSEALSILETIQFNKEVQNISWNENEVKVSCNDGSIYSGDHVIFTGSLGVLKERHKEIFTPELPLFKQNAIESLGIGTVNKIFIKFPYKWWPDDCTGFSFIWNEEDKLKIVEQFPYGLIKDGKSWLQDIFGFYVIDSDVKTLMGWNVGSLAPEVELLSEDIILSGCKYLFDKFLGNKYEIPTPVKVTCTKWHSNKHFRGSYSYRTVNSDLRNASASDLAQPLSGKTGNLTLLFAGEATHSYFYSSVHGALESGFREADRIVDLYMKPEEKYCQVAIIGCGMAGLGAACTLFQTGVKDILILEATDKPGGRVETIYLNGNALEMGAQWLHGNSNYLYKLASENDLLLEETSEEGLGMYVRDDGFVFDDFLVKKIDFMVGTILEKCEKFVDSQSYPYSVGDFLRKEFESYLENNDENDDFKRMAMELYDWHVRFQVIDNSCLNLDEVSAKDWGKYSCPSGQKHLNIKSGYKSLVDLLVKSIPPQALLLDMPVLHVDYSSRKIRLKCRGGTKVFADHVIATPSLGVLKQNLIHFQPELPGSLLATIKSLGFHGMGKVYLVFDRRWWKTDGFQLIWGKDAVVENDKSWIRHLSGFDVVLNQPNVLLGWIGGEGIEIMERLEEETLGRHCVEVLRMFLKDPSIPLPLKVIRSTWTSRPWVRGGYGHATPASDRSGCGPTTLAAPVKIDGVPKILFAGEAIHSSHFSTTYGAFESGEEQAGVLLKFFRRHKL